MEMRISRHLWISAALLAGLALLTIPTSQARETVIAPNVGELEVPAPSLVRVCRNEFWVYSVERQELTRLDPQAGTSLGVVKLPHFVGRRAVTAMGCDEKQSKLFLGVYEQGDTPRVYLFDVDAGKEREIPGKGWIRDIVCAPDRGCDVVRDELEHTASLSVPSAWAKIALPKSKDIPSNDPPTSDLPFNDWQSQFDLVSGKYHRLLQLPQGVRVVLDPARAKLVVQTEGKALRWGNWGTWEGSLMTPKALASVGGQQILIADTGTKVVFAYSISGEYLGALGDRSDFYHFGYPTDLAFHAGTLAVADFMENRVRLFRLPVKSDGKLEIETRADELLRVNLFRTPKVLEKQAVSRCLGCHDGYYIYSLDKFVTSKTHHPIAVEFKGKTDLPLEDGNKVSCASCHEPHHEHKPGNVVELNGKKRFVKSLPAMLRKEERALCVSCHAEQNDRTRNHIDLKKDFPTGHAEVVSCEQCHSAHSAEKKLLRIPVPALCVHCHSANQVPRWHPLNEKSQCTSCHLLHGGDKSVAFAKNHPGPGKTGTCVSCHQKIVDQEGPKSVHLTQVHGKDHKWIASENACVECHSPHAKKLVGIDACLKCHATQKKEHNEPIVISDTSRAEGLTLPDGKVNCFTCHGLPHQGPAPKEKVMNFCASCHGKKTTSLFENFHPRKKKGAHGPK